MKKIIFIIFLVVAVIALPLLSKKRETKSFERTDDTVVVITPHNEAIRYEIEYGFKKWYLQTKGRTVSVDWRTPGSTGEILKYIDSVYINSFRILWEKTLKKVWSQEIQTGFCDAHIVPTPKVDPNEKPSVTARREFLNSKVGCGVDILFGGGVIEHKKEADMGQFVDSGVLRLHHEWFCDDVIPAKHAGDRLWDTKGRWIGSSLSSFGIVFNTERVKELGYVGQPSAWEDLTSPLFFRQVAMVDPVQSSIVIKCFEMILQQQMQKKLKTYLAEGNKLTPELEHKAICDGWSVGLKIIQKLMANARYFTDNSVKTIMDISSGNCAAGIIVDFYGRYQKEILKTRSGSSRVEFVMPKGGSTASPDPIALFRGAPNPEVALAFIEYVLSKEGQNLIGFKVGVPNGPLQYALSRTPIRKDFYREENKPFMLTPEMNPYTDTGEFAYQEAWTAPAFHGLRFISKIVFMDTYNELSNAWLAISKAYKLGNVEKANKALTIFEDLSTLSYDWTMGELRQVLREKNPLKTVELATKLSRQFRAQYKKARQIAQGKNE